MMDLETAAAPPLSQKTHTFQGLNCLTYVYVRFGAVRYVDKRASLNLSDFVAV
jgi:hypothetical protein